MNRSALIVIVDFLLVSLLAFSRLDNQEMPSFEKTGPPTTQTNTRSPQQDVADVLKASLETERQSREHLNEQLQLTQAQLQTREQALSEREMLIREAEQVLREKAEEAARLGKERAALQTQFSATQASLAELQKQLTNTLGEASQSRQHLEAVRNDLAAREQEEAILKRKIAELEKTRQAAEAEKQQLATQLQVADTEKRMARQQLDLMQGEVQVQRQERAKLQEHATKMQEHATKLAEGVTELAEKSGELTQEVRQNAQEVRQNAQEVRENRPLAANTIFNEFVTNRVRGDFRAVRSGAFGREVNREKEAKSILVRQGNQIYAIYHVNETPLQLSFPGVDWDWLIGNLRRGSVVARVDRLSFLAVDPRVVVIPISEAQARQFNCKIYSMPKDPFKFQEAILIGADEGYYGECRFQLDADSPQYIRMQRERFSWLIGKFAPSPGDLVLTKGGELLGVMVNKDFCLLLNEFEPAYHLQTGIGIAEQQTGLLLSQLFGQVARMPAKLQ
jgi:hypothetical protein